MTTPDPCPPRDLFDVLTRVNRCDEAIQQVERQLADLTSHLAMIRAARKALEEMAYPALVDLDATAFLPVSSGHGYTIEEWGDSYHLVRRKVALPLNLSLRSATTDGRPHAHIYDPDESGVCRCETCERFRESQSDPFAANGRVPDRRNDHVNLTV